MRILVVDDDAGVRTAVLHLLHSAGYTELVEAEEGGDALAKFHEEPFDLVITDQNMKGESGLWLTLHIRRHPDGETVPIIMISAAFRPGATGVQASITTANAYGVTRCIPKPFDKEVLLVAIKEVLE